MGEVQDQLMLLQVVKIADFCTVMCVIWLFNVTTMQLLLILLLFSLHILVTTIAINVNSVVSFKSIPYMLFHLAIITSILVLIFFFNTTLSVYLTLK